MLLLSEVLREMAASAGKDSLPRCFQSCRMTLSSDLWTLMTPLYSMKPSSRKRFMKKLTRDRVVPTISASVSCVIFGISVSGSPGLPNSANNRRILARRFSLELKS
jgi:hypothetical protein